jgi:DnaJ-class molecular chaperone
MPRERPYNPNGVGINMNDSLKCMGLSLSATERELKVRFRLLSRKYHPEKHKSEETGLSDEQAKAKFQEFNNAYAYLRTRL